ncbi:MAG: hypothetical protein WCJ93_07835 [Methanomicrobiales archaeon]
MKKQKIMFIALMLGLAVLVVPIVSASAFPFGNSVIKSESEFSGDAVVNETIDLKWTTGTDTYEWGQSSVYNNTLGQKTQSVLNIRQENGSMTWSYQRNGNSIPLQPSVNHYTDNQAIIKPQYRLPYPAIRFLPGIQFI